jgi:hypothetical protein
MIGKSRTSGVHFRKRDFVGIFFGIGRAPKTLRQASIHSVTVLQQIDCALELFETIHPFIGA